MFERADQVDLEAHYTCNSRIKRLFPVLGICIWSASGNPGRGSRVKSVLRAACCADNLSMGGEEIFSCVAGRMIAIYRPGLICRVIR